MSETNYNEIFTNIQKPQQPSSYQNNADIDKLNAAHQLRLQWLNNIVKSLTHRTVLFTVAIVLLLIFAITRYWLVIVPNAVLIQTINSDCKIIISYFVTAVISWFVTKHLDPQKP